jgi:hypothetical protein
MLLEMNNYNDRYEQGRPPTTFTQTTDKAERWVKQARAWIATLKKWG